MSEQNETIENASVETVEATETAEVAAAEAAVEQAPRRRVGRPVNPDSNYRRALAYRNANPDKSNKELVEYMTGTLGMPKASAQVYLSQFKKASA